VLVDQVRKIANRTYREEGTLIEGDRILVLCRKKPESWTSVRGSHSHNYFKAFARKNALALLEKSYTNIR